ncbi:MAG: tRNA (adenosine(37)-N6)-threonylcarbamoyltransferase complex dimerization subunit type 1 TsaB [marine bacterium B5-7]|nr:MAG: tRNA (adenosine(37)-N6)-threonylcarbamoyltransferase complex dimerization subunit type 1 TsaB [marine bacterium B5-7]
MNILALDATTHACSVALKSQTKTYARFEVAPRQHANLLLPMIASLLEEAKLTHAHLQCIAVTVGPGSFTGVRMGLGVAQGLAYGLQLPVVGVSTLAVLAQEAYETQGHKQCLPAWDARMDEIYIGAYNIENGLAVAVQPDALSAPDKVNLPDGQKWWGIGNAWAMPALLLHAKQHIMGHEETMYPTAKALLSLAAAEAAQGKTIDVQQLTPVYLRNKVTN